MGYFPNGSSGDKFREEFCQRCVHENPDDMGCPVWNLHQDAEWLKVPREALDVLIPMRAGGIHADKCAMFIEREDDDRVQSIDERFPDSVHPAYRKRGSS